MAGRCLDIQGVQRVIDFDMPKTIKETHCLPKMHGRLPRVQLCIDPGNGCLWPLT